MKAATREAAMRLLAAMTVYDRAERENRSCSDVFRDFRRSRTFEMLFDKATGLWMNGPDYISEEYDRELGSIKNRA